MTYLDSPWDDVHLCYPIDFLPSPKCFTSMTLDSISFGDIDRYDSSMPTPCLALEEDTLAQFTTTMTIDFPIDQDVVK